MQALAICADDPREHVELACHAHHIALIHSLGVRVLERVDEHHGGLMVCSPLRPPVHTAPLVQVPRVADLMREHTTALLARQITVEQNQVRFAQIQSLHIAVQTPLPQDAESFRSLYQHVLSRSGFPLSVLKASNSTPLTANCSPCNSLEIYGIGSLACMPVRLQTPLIAQRLLCITGIFSSGLAEPRVLDGCDYRVFDEQIDDAQRDRRGEDNENKCLHDSSASHLLLRECFAVADFQLLTVTDRDLGETAARDVVLDNVARRWV